MEVVGRLQVRGGGDDWSTGAPDTEQEADYHKRHKRKSLRPKREASPKRSTEAAQQVQAKEKPIVNEADKEKVYALSNPREKWTKHLVGQAA